MSLILKTGLCLRAFNAHGGVAHVPLKRDHINGRPITGTDKERLSAGRDHIKVSSCVPRQQVACGPRVDRPSEEES